MILPDAAALCEHLVMRTADVVEGVVVDGDACQANIDRAGAVLASSLELVKAQRGGLGRAAAAAFVRQRLGDGLVTREDIDQAALEALESPALADTFARVTRLRQTHLDATQ